MLPRLPPLLLLVAACDVVHVPEQLRVDRDAPADTGAGVEPDPGPDPGSTPAEPLALLARLSLDLRGTRPTLAEVDAVRADPGALDDLVEEFLADPRFTDRVMWTWNDAIHTAAWAGQYNRFGELPPEQQRALGQEPLRMVAAIAAEDRPFTDLVTEDRVQVNTALADLWGISPPEAPGDDGWGWAPLPDGRPMAGALSGNALWLRYSPDELSRNRVRANAVARIFLCADFLDREGSFEFDLDPEALTDIEDAVATQGECLACHASLDPLASFFGGFTWKSEVMDRETYVTFSPHFADRAAARQAPAYYGVPATDLADLGDLVAQDPRFTRCGVERFYTGLVGQAPDPATRATLVQAWVGDGRVVRPLVADIVATDAYRDAAPRVLTPEQLSTALIDLLDAPPPDPGAPLEDGLTALQWAADHRVLGGGTDDVTVLTRNRTPGLGLHVLQAWAAREAIPDALTRDVARPLDDRRLVLTDPGADEATVRAALARLHARFLSQPVEADGAEIDRLFSLWQAAGGDADPVAAWGTATEALARHPAMVLY